MNTNTLYTSTQFSSHASACSLLAAISCRKPHHESSIGAFHPPLNEDGGPIERKGFHVPCKTDLDCFSRCGTHPISGMHYVCTHNVQLYSQAGYGKDAYRDQVTANVQLKASGEPHPKIWLPDSTNEDYYLLDMPGVLAHLKHSQHHDTRLTQYSCR